MADFDKIESLFAELRTATKSVLTDAEQSDIQDFVDAGEYGLALETAVDFYSQEGKTASPTVIDLIRQLAEAMSMDPAPLIKDLARD